MRYRIVQLGRLSHRRGAASSISGVIRRKSGEAFGKVHLYIPI